MKAEAKSIISQYRNFNKQNNESIHNLNYSITNQSASRDTIRIETCRFFMYMPQERSKASLQSYELKIKSR